MKIAISCDGTSVSAHFGRCEKYVVFEEEDRKLISKETLASPPHQPMFLPRFLKENGVSKIMCCGIGPRAVSLFEELGVEVIPGIEGNVDEVISKYLEGSLIAGESSCSHGH